MKFKLLKKLYKNKSREIKVCLITFIATLIIYTIFIIIINSDDCKHNFTKWGEPDRISQYRKNNYTQLKHCTKCNLSIKRNVGNKK